MSKENFPSDIEPTNDKKSSIDPSLFKSMNNAKISGLKNIGYISETDKDGNYILAKTPVDGLTLAEKEILKVIIPDKKDYDLYIEPLILYKGLNFQDSLKLVEIIDQLIEESGGKELGVKYTIINELATNQHLEDNKTVFVVGDRLGIYDFADIVSIVGNKDSAYSLLEAINKYNHRKKFIKTIAKERLKDLKK